MKHCFLKKYSFTCHSFFKNSINKLWKLKLAKQDVQTNDFRIWFPRQRIYPCRIGDNPWFKYWLRHCSAGLQTCNIVFFWQSFGNQNKYTWIDEAPRGLNKKQYSHRFTPLDKDISLPENIKDSYLTGWTLIKHWFKI